MTKIITSPTQRELRPHAYYNWSDDISSYYIDGFCIATLDHKTDILSLEIDMTEQDKDYYYAEMQKEREDYLNQ